MSILLIDNATVKGRMAIGSDIMGVDPAIESAIKAAQLRIETELESGLQRATRSDVFYLDPDQFSGVNPGGVFRLKLRSGLVRSDTPVVLSSGRTWNSVSEVVSSTNTRVDVERGIVYMDLDAYTGLYVRVDYATGFEEGEEIPEWLSEAILAYVPVVFNFGQPTNRVDDAEKGSRMSGDHAMAVLSPYVRNIGFVYRPVF